ncbi:MAG TPA: hypothetical protein VI603_14925 [Saprospiraceae bacterium]|nr:hypothetical protein [Saprospiraceae bacterium]
MKSQVCRCLQEFCAIRFTEAQIESLYRKHSELIALQPDIACQQLRFNLSTLFDSIWAAQIHNAKESIFYSNYTGSYHKYEFPDTVIQELQLYFISLNDTLSIKTKGEFLEQYLGVKYGNQKFYLQYLVEKLRIRREWAISYENSFANRLVQFEITYAWRSTVFDRQIKRLNKRFYQTLSVNERENLDSLKNDYQIYLIKMKTEVVRRHALEDQTGIGPLQLNYLTRALDVYSRYPNYCVIYCPEYEKYQIWDSKQLAQFNRSLKTLILNHLPDLLKLKAKADGHREKAKVRYKKTQTKPGITTETRRKGTVVTIVSDEKEIEEYFMLLMKP